MSLTGRAKRTCVECSHFIPCRWASSLDSIFKGSGRDYWPVDEKAFTAGYFELFGTYCTHFLEKKEGSK